MSEPILLYIIVVEEYLNRERPDSEGCYHIANSKVYPVPLLFNNLKNAEKYIERFFPNAERSYFMHYYDEEWTKDNSRMVSSTAITIHEVFYDSDNAIQTSLISAD